jgi:hypothetical protein
MPQLRISRRVEFAEASHVVSQKCSQLNQSSDGLSQQFNAPMLAKD